MARLDMITPSKKICLNFAYLSLLTMVFLVVPAITHADTLGIGAFAYDMVSSTGGWLVWLAGALLDGALYFFVFQMGDLYQNQLGLTVEALWTFVRDIFNIGFIFGLIYIGFKTILDSEDNNTRKALGLLIAAALLINFSLFITKAVVDFTNLAAFELRDLIVVEGVKYDTGEANTEPLQISGAFVAAMHITSIYNVDPAADQSERNGSDANAVIIFGTFFFLIILAFVFFSGAILLTTRFVALIILMVLSPVMFLGWIVPQLQDQSTRYWGMFLRYAFFAPAYVFMLLLSLKLIQQLQGLGNQADISSLFQRGDNFAQTAATIAVYAVSIGLILATNFVANQMGIRGSETVMSIGRAARQRTQSIVTRAAGGATLGLAARGLRSTIGYAADTAAKSDRLRDFAGATWGGKQLLKATRVVADSSFDARKIAGVGRKLDIGEGRKGGYKTAVEERTKADKDFADSLGKKDFDDLTKEKQNEQINKKYKTEHGGEIHDLAVSNASAAAEAASEARTLILSNLNDDIASLQEEKTELENRLKDSNLSTEDREEVEEELVDIKQQISETNTRYADDINQAKQKETAAVKELEKAKAAQNIAYNKAVKSAQDSYTYQRQLDYTKQVVRSEEFWSKVRKYSAAAAVTLPVFGVSAGTIPLLANTVTAAYMANTSSQSAASLLEEYGKNGEKKAKKDRRLKARKERVEAEADLVTKDSDDNKD